MEPADRAPEAAPDLVVPDDGGPDVVLDDTAPDAERDADARALASVLRMRILRLCLDDALTNQEIAARLGMPPANTYHHVRTLVRRGFLAAQPERVGTRGAREVPYLATRKSWRARGVEGMNRILIDTFLAEAALAPTESLRVLRLGVRLDPEGKAEYDRRLFELMEEFAARPPDSAGAPLSIFYADHEDTGRL